MSSTHQSAEHGEVAERMLVDPRSGWIRGIAFCAVAIAGVVIAWSLLKGADRDLWSRPAAIVRFAPLFLTS